MYLIDTHVLIWSLFDTDNLSDTAKIIIENDEKIFVSIASLWEIAIKQSIGKLKIDSSINEISKQCDIAKINILNIRPEHLDLIKALPPIHNDPFDRLIIAQAIIEKMSLITADSKISKYDIQTKW